MKKWGGLNEKSKLYQRIRLAGWLIVAFMVGCLAMLNYVGYVLYPKVFDAGYQSSNSTMTLTAYRHLVLDKDEAQYKVLKELGENNSYFPYLLVIGHKHTQEIKRLKAIKADLTGADTREADLLLLDALNFLSNDELLALLVTTRSQFNPETRSNLMKQKETGTPVEMRFAEQELLTGLTEAERNELFLCYQKLTKILEVGDLDLYKKSGACSDQHYRVINAEIIPTYQNYRKTFRD